jgi:hypothetical protein
MQGDGTVLLALRFDHTASTEIRMRCTLRSTVRGANNRLDVQSIVSWDREDRTAVPLAAGERGCGRAVGYRCISLECPSLQLCGSTCSSRSSGGRYVG